jgi:predicted N-acetyltransferase YhbS
MNPMLRRYVPGDFDRVSRFLIDAFQPRNRDGNWLQPQWEYMHTHPNLDETSLSRIGVWESDGSIIGVAHYEGALGEAFFQVHPEHTKLKPAMLDHAEAHLCETRADGAPSLRAYINDFDQAFTALARSRGYAAVEPLGRPLGWLKIPASVPAGRVPLGFRIKSLADDNDLSKVHRVLWRGFGHEGEPPVEGLEWRRKMQSGPNFRKDLTIVVEAPSGQFVSYCGLWFDPVNKLAYVEPMATDPDYRHRGLGKAALWEGIRRCGNLGATDAFVGSDQAFYRALGFTKLHTQVGWERRS